MGLALYLHLNVVSLSQIIKLLGKDRDVNNVYNEVNL